MSKILLGLMSSVARKLSMLGQKTKQPSLEDKQRFDIRLFKTDICMNKMIRRSAIRSLRKLLPTLALSRIHMPINELVFKETATIRQEPKFGEINQEKAKIIVNLLADLGIKAKAIDVKWAVMK